MKNPNKKPEILSALFFFSTLTFLGHVYIFHYVMRFKNPTSSNLGVVEKKKHNALFQKKKKDVAAEDHDLHAYRAAPASST